MVYFQSLLVAALASCSLALPNPEKRAAPAYYVLAGDSTTAPKGGWGDGFLSTTLQNGASGKNYGHSGATTASFRAGGDWTKVINEVKSKKGSYDVYVTIQFGHNDQKSTSGVSESQFLTNLVNFANEVKSAGGTPILTTSLTRRTFSGSPPKVVENLATQAKLTLQAASQTNSWSIDLNAASTKFVNAIGPDNAHKYNLASDDNTHLNDHGGVVFGRMVNDLIITKYTQLAQWTKKDDTISSAIAAGKYV